MRFFKGTAADRAASDKTGEAGDLIIEEDTGNLAVANGTDTLGELQRLARTDEVSAAQAAAISAAATDATTKAAAAQAAAVTTAATDATTKANAAQTAATNAAAADATTKANAARAGAVTDVTADITGGTGPVATALTASTEAMLRAFDASHTATFNILDYGAQVDGIELTDCAMTSGSAVLDSTSYTFTSADIGKAVGVLGAGYVSTDFSANANDGVLVSTIASVSGGNATLADVAINTVSGATAVFGTPDDDAISDAQDAAYAARAFASGGGTVFFPPGRTIVTRPLPVKDYVSWAGVHRDVSWVEVIFSAPGTGPAVAGTTDWLSCTGRTSSTPLTGSSFHDFGINARCHIRPGGYTAPIKALNIYYVKRTLIHHMNVWNTGATAIPFDHAYEANYIAFNIIKNPGRLWPTGSVGGGSGIGIGTHSTGVPEPGLIIGNTILGTGDTATAPAGQNGIFLEGQSGSDTSTPSQGYRIIDNYIQGMTNGVALEGDSGTIVQGNTINKCVTGVRITVGQVSGSFPGLDSLVTGNQILNCVAPSGSANDGQGVLIATNSSSALGVRARIVENTINGCAGRGIRVSATTNPINALEISRNRIRNTQRSGVHISNAAGGTLNDLVIESNTFGDVGLSSTAGDVSALLINAPFSHPTIRNNVVNSAINGGLLISTSGALTGGGIISGNDFRAVTVSGSIDKTVRVTANLLWVSGVAQDALLYIPVGALYTLTGTATATDVFKRPAFSLPDAATTTLGTTIALPSDWSEYRIEVVWTAASGSSGVVTWRCDVQSYTTSTTFTNPTAGTGVDATAPTSSTPTVTSVKTAITVDNPFAVINISRLGGGANDTCTNPALLLGLRIVRTG